MSRLREVLSKVDLHKHFTDIKPSRQDLVVTLEVPYLIKDNTIQYLVTKDEVTYSDHEFNPDHCLAFIKNVSILFLDIGNGNFLINGDKWHLVE
jgi:hypothetical protein